MNALIPSPSASPDDHSAPTSNQCSGITVQKTYNDTIIVFVRHTRLEDTLNFDNDVNTYGQGINFRQISLHGKVARLATNTLSY